MNVFSKILEREIDQTVRLGVPLGRDSGPFLARMNAMSLMAGGRGFRQPKAEPKLSAGGKTRRELVAEGIRKPRFLKVRP